VSSSSAVITSLTELTRPLVAFAAVLGLILGGARLAWTARSDSTQSILRGLLLMTVVTGAGAAIVELLLTGFDAMARWVLDSGFDSKSVGERLAALGQLPGTGGGLVFLLAFLGMLASLVQVGIMLIRGAILSVLVGVLPVAAAASITETGYEWFKRLAGWIGSFTVYKLVAAIIYAAAFALIGDATDLAGIVSGFALIIVAILALPALLRLLPPTAAAMGGSSGGGLLAGLATAGATGAVLLAGRGGGGGGSAAPAATTTPGLEQQSPSGANGTAGAGASGANAAVPAGGTTSAGGGASSAGGGTSGGGASGGGGSAAANGGGAGSGAAAGGAAAGAGPAAAAAGAVSVGAQVQQAAKSAANGAVGTGGAP
jgi:type IV secretion system protein TrbL